MSIARDVTTVGAATLTSRLLGFLRDAGIAAILGAGALSDAYFAALQIPNLFRRLLAAVLSAAMVAAGAAQLLCVGIAWMRTDERPRRMAFTSSPAVRRFLIQAL